jgi:acyl carrier protein
MVMEVWVEVLRVQRAGIHDNFFDLGGHSLLATQFIMRLSEVFGIDLPLRDIFEAPTVAELVPVLVQRLAEQEDDSEVTLLLEEVEAG